MGSTATPRRDSRLAVSVPLTKSLMVLDANHLWFFSLDPAHIYRGHRWYVDNLLQHASYLRQVAMVCVLLH